MMRKSNVLIGIIIMFMVSVSTVWAGNTGTVIIPLSNASGAASAASGLTNTSSPYLYNNGTVYFNDTFANDTYDSRYANIDVNENITGNYTFRRDVRFANETIYPALQGSFYHGLADEVNYRRVAMDWVDAADFYIGGEKSGSQGTAARILLKAGGTTVASLDPTAGTMVFWTAPRPDNGIRWSDNSAAQFGGSSGAADYYQTWSTTQANNAMTFRPLVSNVAARSGNVLFTDDNVYRDFGFPTHPDVNVYITSSHASVNSQFLRLAHNRTNAIIESGYGFLNLQGYNGTLIGNGTGGNSHLSSVSPAPLLSACGTTPSVVGTDMAGKITMGSVLATTCTMQFNKTWSKAPACVANDETNILLIRAITNTTHVVFDTATAFTSDVVSYQCLGYE